MRGIGGRASHQVVDDLIAPPQSEDLTFGLGRGERAGDEGPRQKRELPGRQPA